MSYQIKSTPFFRRMLSTSKKNGQLQKLKEEYERIREFNERSIEMKMRQVRLKRLFREIEEIKDTSSTIIKRRRMGSDRLKTEEERRVETFVKSKELGKEYSRLNALMLERRFDSAPSHPMGISLAKAVDGQKKERIARSINYGNEISRNNRQKIEQSSKKRALKRDVQLDNNSNNITLSSSDEKKIMLRQRLEYGNSRSSLNVSKIPKRHARHKIATDQLTLMKVSKSEPKNVASSRPTRVTIITSKKHQKQKLKQQQQEQPLQKATGKQRQHSPSPPPMPQLVKVEQLPLSKSQLLHQYQQQQKQLQLLKQNAELLRKLPILNELITDSDAGNEVPPVDKKVDIVAAPVLWQPEQRTYKTMEQLQSSKIRMTTAIQAATDENIHQRARRLWHNLALTVRNRLDSLPSRRQPQCLMDMNHFVKEEPYEFELRSIPNDTHLPFSQLSDKLSSQTEQKKITDAEGDGDQIDGESEVLVKMESLSELPCSNLAETENYLDPQDAGDDAQHTIVEKVQRFVKILGPYVREVAEKEAYEVLGVQKLRSIFEHHIE